MDIFKQELHLNAINSRSIERLKKNLREKYAVYKNNNISFKIFI